MAVIAPKPAELAEWVLDGCERALQLVADLDEERMTVPLLPTVNPLIWEIAHLAWFQELFVLRRACGHEPILDYADSLYDSGAIPHDTRWRLRFPTREQTTGYLRAVAERVAEEVLRPDATDVTLHFARYTVHHYDMHTEALTYTRQTLGYAAPALPGVPSGVPHAEPAGGDAELPGGRLLLGATMAEPFVYDNEKWAHPVEVAPFAVSRAPVTQAQFAAFVEDGGYADARWWSDGGSWLRGTGARHPVYWRGEPGSWQRRNFDTWVDLEPGLPVSHVSWWEADAYCRWAGRRLPTEAEWEFAATHGATPKPAYPWGHEPPLPRHAATDWLGMGPVEVGACADGDSPAGLRHMIGNVWEWTSSTFDAYPNFERDAYAENSEQFFGARKVLRGGAWLTRGRLLRNTLRNYFTPERRDIVAGLRTCAVRQ